MKYRLAPEGFSSILLKFEHNEILIMSDLLAHQSSPGISPFATKTLVHFQQPMKATAYSLVPTLVLVRKSIAWNGERAHISILTW